MEWVKDVTLLTSNAEVETLRNFATNKENRDVATMVKLLRPVKKDNSLMAASIGVLLLVQIVKIRNQDLNALHGLKEAQRVLNAFNCNVTKWIQMFTPLMLLQKGKQSPVNIPIKKLIWAGGQSNALG